MDKHKEHINEYWGNINTSRRWFLKSAASFWISWVVSTWVNAIVAPPALVSGAFVLSSFMDDEELKNSVLESEEK